MAQPACQFLVTEPHGLDAVRVEVAEGEQPSGRRIDHGDPLAGPERAFAG
ncbi:hypothetical protein AB0L74_31230 [Streptomyces sp. NPDC052020]